MIHTSTHCIQKWSSLHSTSARQQILTTFYLAQIQPNLWDWQKTTVMLAHYKSLFNSTDSNIQFQNCHPPNPNYELIFKRKITFLGAFYEDVVPTVGGAPSASLPHKFWCPWIVVCPQLLLLLGNELFQVQYTHPRPFQLWHWTKWATELDDDMCGGSKSQNTQSSPVSPSFSDTLPEHTEQSYLSEFCNPQALQQCSWPDREQCMAAVPPQRAICFSGACLCAK